MTIPTKQSLSGFIATDPELRYTNDNTARLSMRIGARDGHRLEDGTWEDYPPTFHTVTMFGVGAERAYERFRKGDSFIAEGTERTFIYQRDGETLQGEEFRAYKIGHDTFRTRYDVDRSPRTDGQELAPAQGTSADVAAERDSVRPDPAPEPPDPEPEPAAKKGAPLAGIAGKRAPRASAKAAAEVPF